MNAQRFTITFTIINLIAVLILLAREIPATAQTDQQADQQADHSVIRAEMIELVDGSGQVRAQLKVESNGEAVFRMRDAKGTIRIKIGASEDGSALVLLNDSTEPGVQILAKDTGTSLTLTDKQGKQRAIAP